MKFFFLVCPNVCASMLAQEWKPKFIEYVSCIFSTLFFEAGCVTGSKLILARLASKAPNTRIQMCMPPCLTFKWVLGIQTQIPILA